MKTTVHKNYLLLTIILFITEVLIAFFVYDKLVRNYIGDILVVMLIYCFIKSFWNIPVLKAALFVLLFACSIEFLQYLHFLKFLGLENSKIAALILGRNFTWIDIGAYTAGICLVLVAEKILLSRDQDQTAI